MSLLQQLKSFFMLSNVKNQHCQKIIAISQLLPSKHSPKNTILKLYLFGKSLHLTGDFNQIAPSLPLSFYFNRLSFILDLKVSNFLSYSVVLFHYCVIFCAVSFLLIIQLLSEWLKTYSLPSSFFPRWTPHTLGGVPSLLAQEHRKTSKNVKGDVNLKSLRNTGLAQLFV